MIRRFMSIAIALVMMLSVFAAAATVAAAPSISMVDPTGEYVGPEFREKKADMGKLAEAVSDSPELIGTTGPYGIGDKASYYVDGYGTADFVEFEKRGEGAQVEIWVATDLSFPTGDPRNADPEKVTITQDQVDYLIDQFDEVIYPIESDYFGTPAFHDGSNAALEDPKYEELYEGILDALPLFTDAEGKLMVMVWNMVDDSYYDPTYPSYTAGYYSPSLETYYDRNIIHVDSYDWANRIGADVARPFVYESTIAHEYQHLLHDDLDENEVSFINEGCSMYSEMLCGYGVPWGYIEEFLFTPDNSLTEWGDQGDINIIADYGAAAMFAIYLNDHYGGADLISALAANTLNGEEGVTDTLQAAGYDMDFDEVFKNWRMANLIHSDAFGDGLYNYKSIDLNDARAGKLTTLKLKPGTGLATQSYVYQYTYTLDGYNTGAYLLGPYGTDYLKVQGTRVGELLLRSFVFDGNDLNYPGWYQTAAPAESGLSGTVWFSGASDLRDVSIVADVTLAADAAELSFDAYYAIEEQWDFGFVQISTDGGATWTSLSNANTRDDIVLEGHPDILANMPGFTGFGSGHETFDISAYAGQTVKLAFRYMTDWGSTEKGWYVDNIAIDGAVIDDASTVSSFVSSLPPEDIDFMVTVYAPAYTNDEVSLPYLKVDLALNDDHETVSQSLAQFAGYKDVYVIISTNAGPTNYKFGLMKG